MISFAYFDLMHGILPKFWKFKVVENTPLGKAIFSTEKILQGEIICKFIGPIINLRQFFEKYEADGCNVLQISYDEYIDVIEPYVFFNHSCYPNAGVRNNGVLFALKDINPDEEIFFDYSTTVDDVIWSMDCKCGHSSCRKLIGDFQTLPHDRKQFFYEKGAMIRHLIKTYY